METEEKFEKPIKPKLEEFGLDEQKVKMWRDFKSQCEKKSNTYLWITFGVLSIVGAIVILTTALNYGFIILVFNCIRNYYLGYSAVSF
jgi:hypothetical protein